MHPSRPVASPICLTMFCAVLASLLCAAAAGFVAAPISEWGKPKEPPAGTPLAAQASQAEAGAAIKTPAPDSGFFTEDELGAEIAAITKSLVQRVMPAATGVAAVAAEALAAGAAAAVPGGSPAAKPADAATAPRAPPLVPAQQAQAQVAAPAVPRQASETTSSKKLRLVAAGVTLPHIEKVGWACCSG